MNPIAFCEFRAALLLAVVCVFANCGCAATIEGNVKIPSIVNAPPSVTRYKNPPSAPVAKPDAPVAVVYLEPKEGTPQRTNSARARMEQKGFQFMPGTLVIQKGTTVEFPNEDPDYHSVFSFSKPKRFDLGKYRKDEKPASQTFNQTGTINLRCDIHEHMRGTILVLDTPYFAKTDAGKFEIKDIPAGIYQLKVWFDEKILASKPIELKEHDKLNLDF